MCRLEPLLSPAFTFLTKVSLSRLVLVLVVCNVHSTFRKPYAVKLLVVSDFTLDCSFKVKLGRVRIKVPITCLLWVVEVCNVQPTFRESYAANLLVVSDLTLDRSFKVRLGRSTQKCFFSLIIGSKGLQCTVHL